MYYVVKFIEQFETFTMMNMILNFTIHILFKVVAYHIQICDQVRPLGHNGNFL